MLRTWTNPWTGATLNVLQTANDPVNQRPQFAIGADGKPAKWTGTTSGKTWWNTITVPLFYTNPLGGDYQKYVGGTYHATEMFNFFGNIDELVSDKVANPPIEVGWVRLASWLPWMEMGDRAGMIYIHAAGRKLERFDQLPAVMLKEIETTYPEYRTPAAGRRRARERDQLDLLQEEGPTAAEGPLTSRARYLQREPEGASGHRRRRRSCCRRIRVQASLPFAVGCSKERTRSGRRAAAAVDSQRNRRRARAGLPWSRLSGEMPG